MTPAIHVSSAGVGVTEMILYYLVAQGITGVRGGGGGGVVVVMKGGVFSGSYGGGGG